MIKHNQDGAVNSLMISLILAIVLLVLAAVFGGWAFSSRQDYKNNVDGKIKVAVAVAQVQAAATEKVQLAQDEKQPYYTYQGPPQYGSISFQYPRTWSGYVNVSGSNGSALLDGYFMPPILSSVNDSTANFALRVQVLNQPYAQIIKQLQGQKTLTSSTYTLPLVPSAVGVKVSGPLQVTPGSTGVMVIVPDRTNTIEIWSDGAAFQSDFNTVILPHFSFSP